ncbi:MAG: LptA/OstA family protein [Alphaproteobacteria bacterium]
MKYFIYLAVISCSFFWVGQYVYAQSDANLNPDSDKPLEIVADEALEWHRNDLYFKAKKNVVAEQGSTTLKADLLTALYRNGEGGGIDIYRIQVDGHVKIIAQQNTAYGDNAVYDLDKGYAVLTGKNLRLLSEEQTVTARDKFQYWVTEGRLEAHGDAVAVRLGDKIEADKMIAVFTQNKSGKRVLKTLEAIGDVVITTPSEVLTGNRAMYRAESDQAELVENVTIRRGPNILQGSHAKVNLKTNVSKLFGGSASGEEGGRVRGVFYPGSEEEEK